MGLRAVLTLTIAAVLILGALLTVEARYLPTRSQEDRLDRLRELLRDLLESEGERPIDYDRRGFYKREMPMTSLDQLYRQN
ncbi:proctolin [Lycorma delicatula]|uniref:proctolin n=1 Tax=Lycorma delicatula TaxID=130591 RepID=UPI003F518D69